MIIYTMLLRRKHTLARGIIGREIIERRNAAIYSIIEEKSTIVARTHSSRSRARRKRGSSIRNREEGHLRRFRWRSQQIGGLGSLRFGVSSGASRRCVRARLTAM